MKDKLIGAFSNLLDSAISAAPKIVVGILLVILGLLVAKLIEVVLRNILNRMHLDQLLQKAGLDETLKKIFLPTRLEFVLPRVVYFLVLIVLARTAADALGITAISGAIASFFAYLPKIVAALLLLVVGTTVSQFASKTVEESGKNAGLDFAPALGKAVSGLIMFVIGMMAIGQLEIDTNMVRIVTSFTLGGGALAFGLAFGLGTRDVVRNITAGFYLRKHLVVGKNLEIAGQKGVLRAITATHSILEAPDAGEISVSNATFLEQFSKQ